jgi:hypothetical protein
MDRVATFRLPRGSTFLLGGTVMALALIGGAFMAGIIDMGFGAPQVRIDATSPAAWPQFPE